MASILKPVKDEQTITSTGELTEKRISGLIVNRRPPVEDERGEIVEIYNPSWNLHPDPLVFSYLTMVRPGAVKGWVVHHHQEDRIFLVTGVLRWVFFDNRPDSPTYKMLNDITTTEHNRQLIITPRGVFHAVKNIGMMDAYFINLPTKPYNHSDPDKHRLPIKNDLIPFDFNDGPGW